MRIKTLLIVFTLIGFVTIQGCYDTFNCRSASGLIVTEEIEVEPFEGISFDVAGNVFIQQGSEQSVIVETHQSIIPGISTTVRDGIWNIRFLECYDRYDKFDVHITVPELNFASMSGSGNIFGETPFETERFDATLPGSGNINLEIIAEVVDADISGSGNIIIAGETDQFLGFISGSGNIFAFDIESNNCQVRISGSGNCEVYVNDQLDVQISGSGSVRYKGNPPTVNTTITGSGSVIPVN